MSMKSRTTANLVRRNLRLARARWGNTLSVTLERALAIWSEQLKVSVESGDLLLIERKWYVTHSGLLRLSRRRRCCGIHVEAVAEFSDLRSSRWAFKATVYKSSSCKGYVGYGDA